MSNWTQEQILALAPDASSAKSGRDLSSPRKWSGLGTDEAAAWGLCQGSGKDPYQAQIDLSEPAFRCSCPSRKFPCKHGLGLFLLLSAQPGLFSEKEPPEWVKAWIESRSARAEQRVQKAEAKAKGEGPTADPDAQAKRVAERERKVAAGVQELERWLDDLIRRGLAEAQVQPASFWDGVASRMVDAQAPGLARMVRELAGIPATGDGWPARLLEALGKIHLLLEGYSRLETLPPDTQADIRTRIGWPIREEDVLSGEGTRDRWHCLGQQADEEDRLRVQRTWLWGEGCGRPALLLQFAHGNAPIESLVLPGCTQEAELAFYPGAQPLRALVKQRGGPPEPLSGMPGYATLLEATAAYTEAVARDPWLGRVPVALRDVVPVRSPEGWSVRDMEGAAVPISPRWERGWKLLAASGGHPVGLFGEWDGAYLHPLSAWAEGRLLRLEPGGAL